MSDSKGTETDLAGMLESKGVTNVLEVTETKVCTPLNMHAELATARMCPANLRDPAAVATNSVVLSLFGLGPLGMTFR